MSGQSLAESVLSRCCGAQCSAGEYVCAEVDRVYITDASASSVLDRLSELGVESIPHPERLAVVVDHYVPAPSRDMTAVHHRLRSFARSTGCVLVEEGEGICHQVLAERGFVRPGQLVVGADSHTVTYGAMGAFATGVGSTDAAVAAATGRLWFRVPESGKMQLRGALPARCSGRDVALHLNGSMGPSGADYLSVEIDTENADISPDHLSAVSNAAAEWGAKAAVCVQRSGAHGREGHRYVAAWEVDLGDVSPMVALPHSPHRTVPVGDVAGRSVQLCFIGTCSGGTLEDLRGAADVLYGSQIDADVRLLAAPASRRIYVEALERGIMGVLVAAGAVVLPPGCGPCCATAGGIPGPGETVLSTAGRNYRGRMGNPEAEIYLASAETVAASAITGSITDPREVAAT